LIHNQFTQATKYREQNQKFKTSRSKENKVTLLICHGVRRLVPLLLLLRVGEEEELKMKPLLGVGEDEELLVLPRPYSCCTPLPPPLGSPAGRAA